MNTNLPIYEAVIATNEDGITIMSLVDRPATKSDFIAFEQDDDKTQSDFIAFEQDEQRVLLGVVMRANRPIYRNQNGKEYYLRFSAETLRVMAEKLLLDGVTSQVDRQHDLMPVEGVNLQQLFIKDTARGINPEGFSEIEDGSLFAVYKVHNDSVWESVKRGEFTGFSLYGRFSILDTPTEESVEDVLKDIYRLLRSAKDYVTN